MTRVLLLGATLALALPAAAAFGQQGAKALGKPGAEKPAPERSSSDRRAQERQGQDRSAPTPVIGCPSLANYRLLMRRGGPAAAALLADPTADHLGCAALPRGRLTGIADRVALGAQSYDCASVQGTTACHWMEAGTVATPATRTAR